MTHILLLLRLPFLFAGCVLGGCLWWVTRRLYGNLGGYTALALYCFSPAILKACVTPEPGVLAALGVYGGVYTCIGVAHAMQGRAANGVRASCCSRQLFGSPLPRTSPPCRWWRCWAWCSCSGSPKDAAARCCRWSCWPAAGALVRCLRLLRLLARRLQLCLSLRRRIPLVLAGSRAGTSSRALANAGITIAAVAALVLYLGLRRSRYFGNTAPLFCAVVLSAACHDRRCLAVPWLWALPFLFTFVGGVFADAYESPRGRLALAAGAAIRRTPGRVLPPELCRG